MKRAPMSTANVNEGSNGFKVTKVKYDCIRKAMLSSLPTSQHGVTFKDLVAKVKSEVGSKTALFPKAGSVMWYTKVVQLDLEKRKVIERIPGVVPQRIRRVK